MHTIRRKFSMKTTVQTAAQKDLGTIQELNHVVLSDPQNETVLAEQDQQRVRELAAQIDMTDTNSIIAFGAPAQGELQSISQSMLGGVRNKDVGPAGDSLRTMVTTIRGFAVSEGDTRSKRTFWEKLLGRVAPFAKFTARFEEVQNQLDRITDELLRHEHALLKDIKSLDQLYAKTLEFYDELALYITAGEFKIEQLDNEVIPAAAAAVDAADPENQVIKAQELRDLRSARDDLERRVHDLKLTRQVVMQSLPSIRLVQENDKSLVTKINSTLVNTVPLWETQLAQAVTIQRSQEAAQAVRGANDLTNELLTSNAANLRDANAAVRKEVERGIFDIDAVAKANEDLIGTIEESLSIADEGKAKRAEAEAKLKEMEADLRNTLASAKARKTA
jgi:uncharacterized protein YaaN involved in tellurite resistance